MTARLTIVIPGNPGDGSVNAAYKPGVRKSKRGSHATMVKTKRGEGFEQRVVLFGRSAKNGDPGAATAVRSAVKLGATVTAYWPTRRHLEGTTDLANGDADSPIKGTLDPLQDWYGKGKRKKKGAGIFDTDARIIEVIGRKVYDPDNPRIVVEVYPLDDSDKDDG